MGTEVLVLGGGPDSEREVSLWSSKAVAESLESLGRFRVRYEVIGRLTAQELKRLPGEVIFPVLHGGWGEGGPLQDLLEADGRAFVGCGPRAARVAMDKMATKMAAAKVGIATAPAAIFNPNDVGCPIAMPVVIKPIHEGSSVGVHIVRTDTDLPRAHEAVRQDQARHPGRVYMIEQAILGGRELTVGVLDSQVLAPIEIIPAVAFYDYAAKYTSDDTKYQVAPNLPAGVTETIQQAAAKLCREVGVRHLARVDFILDKQGQAWLLEVNTMPGFTSHSLLPMAAKHAGLSFADLCARLVELAKRDHAQAKVKHGRIA
jgi:D-alanine-D-alanine ligase